MPQAHPDQRTDHATRVSFRNWNAGDCDLTFSDGDSVTSQAEGLVVQTLSCLEVELVPVSMTGDRGGLNGVLRKRHVFVRADRRCDGYISFAIGDQDWGGEFLWGQDFGGTRWDIDEVTEKNLGSH